MVFSEIAGSAAMVASLAFAFIGLPHQILRNRKNGNCDGVASTLIYAGVCTYTLWALYGWTKPDYFVAWAQTPGAIFSWILLYQLFRYRKRAESE